MGAFPHQNVLLWCVGFPTTSLELAPASAPQRVKFPKLHIAECCVAMEVKTGEAKTLLQHSWGPAEPKGRRLEQGSSRREHGQDAVTVTSLLREAKDALRTRASPEWARSVWQEYPLVGEQPGESFSNHHTHTHKCRGF